MSVFQSEPLSPSQLTYVGGHSTSSLLSSQSLLQVYMIANPVL
jgi:hypothetical protein